MRRPSRNRPSAFACFSAAAVVLSLAGATRADDVLTPPEALMFVGLTNGEWRIFIGGMTPQPVPTSSEPRTPAYSRSLGRIAYVSSAGAVHEVDLASGKDVTLLEPTRAQAYTQLAYRPRTDELYVVVLHRGTSVDTDLARVDRAKRTAVIVSRQRSAQFEPSFTKDGAQLIYSSVLCASECPRIIQEVWRMDVVSGVPRQLTLLNGISRQASADEAGRIVFASNIDGHFQLWRIEADGGTPQRLTQAGAVDESPVADERGEVFFIRRTAEGGRLMHLNADLRTRAVGLPASIADVRDLRWGR